MRLAIAAALAAALLCAANTANAAGFGTSEKCGPLEKVNTLQMIRTIGDPRDYVPLTFEDGGVRYFLFDTGGDVTQIDALTTASMKLQAYQTAGYVRELGGRKSAWAAKVGAFIVGHMRAGPASFYISPIPAIQEDGIWALDNLKVYDVDVDFGSDVLNFFSQKHCPGNILHWEAPAVATLPMDIDGGHISIPVTLDGKKYSALLDTGATRTLLRMDIAEDDFKLNLGNPETPENGILNGNKELKTYAHIFKEMDFGGIVVSNPHTTIIPKAPHTPYGNLPEITIGMDVLRQLHLYLAFNEEKLYVSEASRPDAAPQPLPVSYMSNMIKKASAILDSKPEDPDWLALRCYWRALEKKDLDSALADCEKSLQLKADNPLALRDKGLVLFQQAKYQDVIPVLDAAIKANPTVEASLIRGYAKGKLGDAAGKDADVAAAKSGDPEVVTQFQRLGISE